jgi:hypothetical protein
VGRCAQRKAGAKAVNLTDEHRTDLLVALGATMLDDRERRFVEWLAGWDQPTVDAAVSLIGKLLPSDRDPGRDGPDCNR